MFKLGHWLIDYVYLLRGQTYSFIYRKPPSHYLDHIVVTKNPIVFIPGILENWGVFSKILNKISLLGHPVYIVPKLGRTMMDIPNSAKVIQELILQNNLRNVVIIAHSKGGLIGKYILCHLNTEKRVKSLVCIATPFSGVVPLKFVPIKHYKELSSSSTIIADLQSHTKENKFITSIYPIFDNHVWPQSSSYLKGAANMQIPVQGHHKILFSDELESELMKLI